MRQYIRHPFSIPIKYKTGDNGLIHDDDMQNISQGGLRFQSNEPVAKGAEIVIKISVKVPPFEASGVVTWCSHEGDHYEVGVMFDSPTMEFAMRMVEQVCYIEQYRRDVEKYENRSMSTEEAAREWVKKYAKDFPS